MGAGKWNEKGLPVDGKCWPFPILCLLRPSGECGNDTDCVNLSTPDLLVLVPSHREISAETDREPQQLQNYWSEVRYMVRCIYRQAGTPLADDQDQSLVPDKEGVKELVDRYTLPMCHVSP